MDHATVARAGAPAGSGAQGRKRALPVAIRDNRVGPGLAATSPRSTSARAVRWIVSCFRLGTMKSADVVVQDPSDRSAFEAIATGRPSSSRRLAPGGLL